MESITTPEYIYDQLMSEIADGLMEPGQHLSAIPIAKKYGVSRTPVLVALHHLEADGIVQFYPGKGAKLVDPSVQEVHDAFEVRTILEIKAMELAIKNSDLIFIARLREAINAEKLLSPDAASKSEAIKCSLTFHLIIAQNSHNLLLEKYLKNLLSSIYVYQMLLCDVKSIFEGPDSWQDHEKILGLIEKKDMENARIELDKHIQIAAQNLITQF